MTSRTTPSSSPAAPVRSARRSSGQCWPLPGRPAARRLFARRAEAVRDGAASSRARRIPALRYFIGDVRDERPPAPRARGHRHRHPRRGAEAGAGGRIQPVRMHQDQRARRAEPDRGLPRQRASSASSRCPPTRRPRRSTSTARPSCAPTSCSSPPTTSRAIATCASRVVRYGNVMGSRGSVIPFFLEQARRAACCRSPIRR